ncbi:trehalose operon transcriptional repressor [Mesobacillus campisalis]|uniref:Trehalose operon repressor n=1 Tax=Mesobacillus campisalis TaxID=1408103 RepID=A0A0M2SR82_9BACI|nr:trehalose operon repressor [Mesobacillus campisalis]KKK36186.1 trehalose operon transcriptional repressor [Mesobacillus campisalis]
MKNKYLVIYDELARKIQEGEYPARTILPSENELTETYQTSRETIRKALNLLAQKGLIQKIRGKGSIVLDLKKLQFPISGLVSFKELAGQMGSKAETAVEKFTLGLPDEEIVKQLNVNKEEPIWSVTRVRKIDGEKIILDKDHLVEKYVPGLTKEVCAQSIFDFIEGQLGRKISFAKKEFTVEEPSKEDRTYLDMEGFHAIVVVKNYIYFDDATLFQFTESRHRPDKFRFVDFARRMDRVT